jgi:hypothetical protein
VINFQVTGTFIVSFQTDWRFSGAQSFNVLIDSTVVGSFTPTSHSFTLLSTSPFTVSTTGNHTLSFVGTGTSSDGTDFLDSIQILTQ